MIRYLMCILLLLSVVISGCGKTDKITETAAETQNYTVHDIRGKKLPLLKTRTNCQQLCLCRRNIIGSRRPSKNSWA